MMPIMTDDSFKSLIVENLSKSYQQNAVVKDVSMRVNRGQVVGLLGPNGAGKTTCFYMITGLVGADGGNIYLNGHNVTKLPMYRRARLGLGYLPQEASIFRGLTVEQNIMSVLEISEPVAGNRRAILEELLGEFSLTHIRKNNGISLSGGERRRVEIARALASKPSFILLDEPLAGIDPVAIDDIRELIVQLKNKGLGILITDHNVREALDIIDHAYIMYDGVIMKEGTAQDIINDEEVRRVYLGSRFG